MSKFGNFLRMRLSWLGGCVFFLFSAQAEVAIAQSVTISGYVEDSTSLERIPGASVSIPVLEIGGTTNQYGFYSITTEPGSIQFLVSHVGYEPALSRLELTKDTTLIVRLEPRIIRMDDLEVVADRESGFNEVQMSRHEIPIEEIETLPVIFGEIDIQKALQLLPSVQSGIEGTSGLYVRGGRADQNLILLDGLTLYNPNHLFGLFSVFHSAAMKRVEFIKGGFPARYGGRLSSVVNYTMKEGNLKKFEGEGGIGLFSSRAMLEGPIVKDRASFLISGRRTYIDQLLRPFQLLARNRYRFAFYDLNAKVNYILSSRDRIYLSGYAGKDWFAYKRKPIPVPGADDHFTYNLGWHNRLGSLRWNRLIGDRLFSNTLVGVTQYRFYSGTDSFEETDGETIQYDQTWHSEITDWTAKIDFEFIPNSRHYARFGFEAVLHNFTPGSTQTRLDESGRPPLNLLQTPTGTLRSREIALYAEDEIQLHHALRVSTGIRISGYDADDKRYGSIEPRLGVRVRINDRTAVKVSYARSKQYVHLLTGSGASFPTDLWIPSMDLITPQRGYQLALGIHQSYRNGDYDVSIESYLKRMEGHLEYKMGADRLQSAFLNWPDIVEIGKGSSYGAEFFVNKKQGRLTGWIGYTWARTTRQFESLNDGLSFPDGFDRRHDISVVLQYKLSGNKHLSAVWAYGSGYPVWVASGRYVSSGEFPSLEYYFLPDLLDFGPVNSARAPSSHRLDIGMHFRKEKSWGERTISVGLYNAYNNKNPMFVYPKSDSVTRSPLSYRQISLLQLLPSVSWEWKFE